MHWRLATEVANDLKGAIISTCRSRLTLLFFHDSHGPDGSFLGDSPSLTPDLYKGKILVLGKSIKSLDFVAYWLRNMALESVNQASV